MRVLLIALLLPACATVAGLSEYQPVDCVPAQCGASVETGTEDSATPPDTTSDDVADTAASETVIDSVAVDTAKPDVPPPLCPSAATKLVTIGGWSIDATEVTNAQYAAFLVAKGTDVSGQPAFCTFNTTYKPSGAWPAPAAQCDHPVVRVDWCDAHAYCKWAGKRLCGNPTGGATPFTGIATLSTSQWFAACSRAMGSRYIYGTTYIAGACVDDSYDGKSGLDVTDVRRQVGTAPSCRGAVAPYDALFDMNGNVSEWEDNCSGMKDRDDECHARGGSYLEPGDKADCNEGKKLKRADFADDLGFRCCSL